MINALGDLDDDTIMIMAGRESSYFLIANGVVKSCGRNDEGQLGDGTFVNSEFTEVAVSETVSNLGSGPSSQSAFFFGENAVYGAGANDRFQLGLGEIGSQTFPVEVDFKDLVTVEGIIKISSSGTQTVALNIPVKVDDGTDFPTVMPTTYMPTTIDGIPTFSPTATPTEGNIETSMPSFSPTACKLFLSMQFSHWPWHTPNCASRMPQHHHSTDIYCHRTRNNNDPDCM